MKPKIMLVPDIPGWAFDQKCDNIISNLSHKYDFFKVYFLRPDHFKRNIGIMSREFIDSIDLVYFFDFTMCEGQFPRNMTVCGIAAMDLFLTKDEVIKKFNYAIAGNPVSKLMYEAVSNNYDSDIKLFDAQNGVNTELFKHDKTNNDVFTIGWTGNKERKFKRFNEMKNMIDGIPGVRFAVLDFKDKIPHADMPKFYNSLDAYVCFSTKEEGFCNPLIEAGACEVPIISSDCGVAKEVAGGIIINNLDEMKEAILRLKNNKKLRKLLGEEARANVIDKFTWVSQSKKWDELFSWAINRNI